MVVARRTRGMTVGYVGWQRVKDRRIGQEKWGEREREREALDAYIRLKLIGIVPLADISFLVVRGRFR